MDQWLFLLISLLQYSRLHVLLTLVGLACMWLTAFSSACWNSPYSWGFLAWRRRARAHIVCELIRHGLLSKTYVPHTLTLFAEGRLMSAYIQRSGPAGPVGYAPARADQRLLVRAHARPPSCLLLHLSATQASMPCYLQEATARAVLAGGMGVGPRAGDRGWPCIPVRRDVNTRGATSAAPGDGWMDVHAATAPLHGLRGFLLLVCHGKRVAKLPCAAASGARRKACDMAALTIVPQYLATVLTVYALGPMLVTSIIKQLAEYEWTRAARSLVWVYGLDAVNSCRHPAFTNPAEISARRR